MWNRDDASRPTTEAGRRIITYIASSSAPHKPSRAASFWIARALFVLAFAGAVAGQSTLMSGRDGSLPLLLYATGGVSGAALAAIAVRLDSIIVSRGALGLRPGLVAEYGSTSRIETDLSDLGGGAPFYPTDARRHGSIYLDRCWDYFVGDSTSTTRILLDGAQVLGRGERQDGPTVQWPSQTMSN